MQKWYIRELLVSLLQAEEAKVTAQRALEIRSQQAEQDVTNLQKALNEHDSRLKELLINYEALVDKMGSAADSALVEIGEGIINPELPQAAIESQKAVIDFLRNEKEQVRLYYVVICTF